MYIMDTECKHFAKLRSDQFCCMGRSVSPTKIKSGNRKYETVEIILC